MLDVTTSRRICEHRSASNPRGITLITMRAIFRRCGVRQHRRGPADSGNSSQPRSVHAGRRAVEATLSWNMRGWRSRVRHRIGHPSRRLRILGRGFSAPQRRDFERHATGPGLAIVKQLVEHYDGQIGVPASKAHYLPSNFPCSRGQPPPRSPGRWSLRKNRSRGAVCGLLLGLRANPGAYCIRSAFGTARQRPFHSDWSIRRYKQSCALRRRAVANL